MFQFKKIAVLVSLALCSAMSAGCDRRSTADLESKPAESNLDSESTISKTNTVETPGVHSGHPSFYTVSEYDKSADPAEDLKQTLERAQAENKRVLLQVGGDWCDWCTRISKFMAATPDVKSHLEKHFLVLKVTYPGEHSEAFLADYPEREAYPHFFVLDSNGQFLHSQGTGELEKGDGYDEALFMQFLTKWTR